MMDCKKKMLDLLGGSVSAGCGALLDSQPSSQSGFNGFISHCKLQQGGGGKQTLFCQNICSGRGRRVASHPAHLFLPLHPRLEGSLLCLKQEKKKNQL